MNNTVEQFMKNAGFKHLTGPLWKHEEMASFGIIDTTGIENCQALAVEMWRCGKRYAQEEMRKVIGL